MRFFKSWEERSYRINPFASDEVEVVDGYGFEDDNESDVEDDDGWKKPAKKKKKEKVQKGRKEKKKARKNRDDVDAELFPEVALSRKKIRVRLREFLIFSPWMRLTYVIVFCVLIGFVAPLLINQSLDYSPPLHDVSGTCHVKEGVRTDCFPDRLRGLLPTPEQCRQRGCCYQELNLLIGAPVCHHTIPPMHLVNVTASHQNQDSDDVKLDVSYDKPWPHRKYAHPALKTRQVAPGHVGFLFYDKDEPPSNVALGDDTQFPDVKVRVKSNRAELDDRRLRLKVTRKDDDATELFDTSYGPVILGHSLSEISLLLPKDSVYGLGGHPYSFQADRDNSTYKSKTMYNVDTNRQPGQQHAMPIFMAYDGSRDHYGMYIQSSRPVTIEVLPGLNNTAQKRPLVTFRSMGGYLLLHLFTGPTPEKVVDQLTAYLGRPRIPPVWALGYHVCRNTGSRQAFLENWSEMTDSLSPFPFDTDCVDEKLSPNSFTLNDDLADDVTSIRTAGKRLLLSHPAQVDVSSDYYTDGYFVKESGGKEDFVAMYNKQQVALPDFTHPSFLQWYQQSFDALAENLDPNGDIFSGLTLIHNSPYVQTSCTNLSQFSFVPMDIQSSFFADDTICPNAVHFGNQQHLDLHNSYSLRQMRLTKQVLPDKYQFTEHSSPGVSQHGGVLGTQLQADWANLRPSLKEVLELGMYGVPIVSMTACGVETYRELDSSRQIDDLCLHWYQLAAYMPSMNSFYGTEQHNRMPYTLPGAYMERVRRAVRQRYQLMPYFHTLAHQANVNGLPIVRPMFFEFPDDFNVYEIQDQFMLGDGVLVSPLLDAEAASQLDAYFPHGPWYDLWSGQLLRGAGQSIEVPPTYQMAAHIRGGKIIPTLERGSLSVEGSYADHNYALKVALTNGLSPRGLGSDDDDRAILVSTASGKLYLADQLIADDPVLSIEAFSNAESGQISLGQQGLDWAGCVAGRNSAIGSVEVYGLAKKPVSVTTGDGQVIAVTEDYSNPAYFQADFQRLQVLAAGLDWCTQDCLTLTWQF